MADPRWPSLAKSIDETYVESHDGREVRLLEQIYASPRLDTYRNNPAALLEAIDDYAANDEFLINIGHHKGGIVADLIRQQRPSVFVELGGYLGYSAISFGQAMRDAAAAVTENGGEQEKGLRYWSLEADPLFASIAMNLVELAGLSEVVKVVVGPAEASLKRLCKEGRVEGVDMLFLDHLEELYVSDLKVCEELGVLRTGAMVVADNVVRPGAPEYREYVRSSARMESRGIRGLIMPGEFEDELEVSRVL